MNERNKAVATIGIWFSAMIISIFVLVNSIFLGSGTVAALAIPMGLAFLTTAVVWNSPPSNKTPSNEKKGDNTAYTMALLMEMMDEDERQAFKSRLQERILSGDSVTDGSIIQEMEKRKRG